MSEVPLGEHELEQEEVVSEAPTADPKTGSVAFLVVKRNGKETDERFEVHPPATIGRFDPSVGPIDIDLGNIPEGTYVSRKHARITLQDGEWKISDLGSSNGTYVLKDDFERIEESGIADGSEIALGNARFVFHIETNEVEAPEIPEAEPEPPQTI